MKALYPGSFNPWHQGHQDILEKAKKVFTHVDTLKVTKEIGLLSEYIKDKGYDIIIRGLRNASDMEYEKNLQYWYEDLGLKIPIVYFICDRNNTHISSSVIRSINELKA
jgi:pantetheine-phosphate adenylyltransferase